MLLVPLPFTYAYLYSSLFQYNKENQGIDGSGLVAEYIKKISNLELENKSLETDS